MSYNVMHARDCVNGYSLQLDDFVAAHGNCRSLGRPKPQACLGKGLPAPEYSQTLPYEG
jgi:hypothetical protein